MKDEHIQELYQAVCQVDEYLMTLPQELDFQDKLETSKVVRESLLGDLLQSIVGPEV